MADVLLTYGWVRSSYAAMRNLSRHGVHVWASDSQGVGMSQWSRHKAGFSRYVSHYDDEAKFVEQIADLCQSLPVRLVFPSHNETEILAKHRDRLRAGADALLPSFEHCQVFNNKARAYELARSAGIPVPIRLEYRELDGLTERMAEAGLSRVVIKLLTGNSAKGVFYADTPADAERLVRGLVDKYALVPERYPQIEERVAGVGVGCSVLYWNGEPVADFGHKRLREKTVTGGTSTLREAMRHEQIRQATHQLFRSIGWHGLAMAEYKYCEDTDRFWFIEVNPRMWGSIPLAISAGVEFPYLAWLCATEGPDRARAYDASVAKRFPWRGRWLLGDLIVVASQVSKLQLRDAADTLFAARANAIDDFYWDDPGAFLGELANYGSRFVTSMSLNPEEKGMVG